MVLAIDDYQYRDTYFIVGNPMVPIILIAILVVIGVIIFKRKKY